MIVILRQKGSPFIQEWAGQWLSDFKTVPKLASALLIFLYLDIGSIRWINALASSAFTVYVIHSTPTFYGFLWKDIFCTGKWLMSDYYPLYTAGVVATVYLSGALLEILRRMIIDRWLLSRVAIRKMLRIVDGVYAKVDQVVS